MAATLRYHFDLVCPYSYLLAQEVEAAEAEGLHVEWAPFELRPAPQPLPEPRGDYIRRHWREHVYTLAELYGTEIHVPVVQPRSTLALSASLWAEEQDAGRAWRRAARHAFFVLGRDISQETVLREIAEQASLDPDAAVAAAWDPDRLRRLRELRDEGEKMGVESVPSLSVADRKVFFGAPTPGLMREALAAWDKEDPDMLARLLEPRE